MGVVFQGPRPTLPAGLGCGRLVDHKLDVTSSSICLCQPPIYHEAQTVPIGSSLTFGPVHT